jgi:hypothetical protein
MVVVLNSAGVLTLALAISAWALAQATGFEPYKLVAGFGVMGLVGALLEAQPKARWRPRYFWIMPAWVPGFVGSGMALRHVGLAGWGNLSLGIAAAVFFALFARAATTKPGGRWLVLLGAAASVVVGFQVLGAIRPEWKHPVFYVINALALLACVAFALKLYRARTAA